MRRGRDWWVGRRVSLNNVKNPTVPRNRVLFFGRSGVGRDMEMRSSEGGKEPWFLFWCQSRIRNSLRLQFSFIDRSRPSRSSSVRTTTPPQPTNTPLFNDDAAARFFLRRFLCNPIKKHVPRKYIPDVIEKHSAVITSE